MDKTIIKMVPEDYYSLFTYEEGADPNYISGEVIGDADSIKIKDKLINIGIPNLKHWLNTYVDSVLIPCESGDVTIDDINKTFDWKSFHEEGIKLANKIKQLLPDDVILKYSGPFEDRSEIIQGELII